MIFSQKALKHQSRGEKLYYFGEGFDRFTSQKSNHVFQ